MTSTVTTRGPSLSMTCPHERRHVEQFAQRPPTMPNLTFVDHIEEPRIKATILVADEIFGDVLSSVRTAPRDAD